MLKLRSLLILLLLCVLNVNIYAQEESTPFSPENVDNAEEFRVFGRGSGTDIVFASNGGTFAVNTPLGVWVYNSVDREPILLTEPVSYFSSIALSPRGNVLAVVDPDNPYTVTLWSTASGRETRSVYMPEPVYDVEFGHDAQTLLVMTSNYSWPYTLRVYSVAGNETQELFTFPDAIALIKGSAHDDRVLVVTPETVNIYSLKTGEQLGSLEGLASGAVFSPNGKLIATYNDNYETGDNEVKIWNAETYELVNATSGHTDLVSQVAFSPNGQQVVSVGYDNALFVWPIDPDTGILHRTLRQVRFDVSSYLRMAFDPTSESDLYAVGGGTLSIYDTIAETVRVLDATYATEVLAVAMHPNGETLASSSMDDGVRIWDTTTGLLAAYSPGYASVLAYHIDGAWLAAKDSEGIRFLNPDTGEQIARIDLPEDPNPYLSAMALSPDNTRLATRFEGVGISIFDVTRLPETTAVEPILEIPLDSKFYVADLVYSPDGTRLFGAVFDRLVMWDAATGEVLAEQQSDEQNFIHLALSPDGTTLASFATYTDVTLWNAADLSLQQHLSIPEDYPNSAAFSPDGSLLAVGMGSGATAFWRVADSQLLGSVQVGDYAGQPSSLAFSMDGRMLAIGHGSTESFGDATVSVWRVRE